jgi:ATP-binding cassette subfamily B protein
MIQERVELCTTLIENIISSLLLIFGVWQVIQNQLTIGQLIAFNMLVTNVITPLKRMITLWNNFQEIRIAIERTDDVVNTKAEAGLAGENLVTIPPITGQIRFENVTFRYNSESETNTIENLSFEIQPGQTIALVGRSGSGKTTISKLLLGLYAPVQGKITIDGYDINKISLKSLRQQTGVVNQDTFLFGGTILENLTIGHPNASQAAIEEASHLAGAADFIEELPLKYGSQVGEGGGLLSGGQRQRLAIARALLGKPRLLVLDEATSSLDAESERIIQNNLNTILKNQTTLVIAHRLSTVRTADLILVMDRGVLVESGTHEALMAQRGQYFHLNQQQLAIAD